MNDSTALVPREQGSIVRASGDIAEALKEYQKIQAALDKAMPECIMKIQGREFRKKHYWRAIATAFNLNVECVKEERSGGDFLMDSTAGFSVTYRATAPNGRYADGDGSCASSEKKSPAQKTAHNIRSHAHTRAFNRAVSNLVGFGEVSAEEAGQEEHQDEPGSHDGPPSADRSPQKSAGARTISEPQRRRLYAISKSMQSRGEMSDDDMKDVVGAILKKHGFDSSTEVTTDKYEAICTEIENHG